MYFVHQYLFKVNNKDTGTTSVNKIVFAELIEQFNLSLPHWKRQKTKYFMMI